MNWILFIFSYLSYFYNLLREKNEVGDLWTNEKFLLDYTVIDVHKNKIPIAVML